MNRENITNLFHSKKTVFSPVEVKTWHIYKFIAGEVNLIGSACDLLAAAAAAVTEKKRERVDILLPRWEKQMFLIFSKEIRASRRVYLVCIAIKRRTNNSHRSQIDFHQQRIEFPLLIFNLLHSTRLKA